MSPDLFDVILEKYIKSINNKILSSGVIGKSKFGINNNGHVHCGYSSFYPQEIDLIIDCYFDKNKCHMVAETMNQDGSNIESVYDIIFETEDVELNLASSFDLIIEKLKNRLASER